MQSCKAALLNQHQQPKVLLRAVVLVLQEPLEADPLRDPVLRTKATEAAAIKVRTTAIRGRIPGTKGREAAIRAKLPELVDTRGRTPITKAKLPAPVAIRDRTPITRAKLPAPAVIRGRTPIIRDRLPAPAAIKAVHPTIRVDLQVVHLVHDLVDSDPKVGPVASVLRSVRDLVGADLLLLQALRKWIR